MTQNAVVISADEVSALLETERTSACDSCGQHDACAVCKKKLRVTVPNEIGAKTGDRVTIESGSANILGSAAAVFVAPLVFAFIAYAVTAVYTSDPLIGIGIPIAVFTASFMAISLILNAAAKKNPDIKIISIDVKSD